MSSIDIESLIAKYDGETKLNHLLFWAEHPKLTDEQRQICVHKAVEYIQANGGHADIYEQLMKGSATTNDYLQHTQQEEQAQLNILEARLSSAQSSLNKDSIRSAYLNLANFQASKGHLNAALKNVFRSRDYCSTRIQTGQVCLLVVELSLVLSKWSQVREWVNKAQHAQLDAADEAKLPVAAGIAWLAEGKFREACREFRKVRTVVPTWRTIVCPEDITTYSALTALSELSRDELCKFVETTPHLESQPQLFHGLREYAVKCNYKGCLDALKDIWDMLDLDIYLHGHWRDLQNRIWQRSIVDYTRPFCKVSVVSLCTSFGLHPEHDMPHLYNLLVTLIGQGKLQHRLNCRTQTLELNDNTTNDMAAVHHKLQVLQDNVLNDVYSMMVRLACLESHSGSEESVGGRSSASAAAAAVAFGGHRDVVMDEEQDDDVDDDDENDLLVDFNMANPLDDEML